MTGVTGVTREEEKEVTGEEEKKEKREEKKENKFQSGQSKVVQDVLADLKTESWCTWNNISLSDKDCPSHLIP